MLREGRLKRIKSYISPSNGNQSAGILNKFCCELVDEVEPPTERLTGGDQLTADTPQTTTTQSDAKPAETGQ